MHMSTSNHSSNGAAGVGRRRISLALVEDKVGLRKSAIYERIEAEVDAYIEQLVESQRKGEGSNAAPPAASAPASTTARPT